MHRWTFHGVENLNFGKIMRGQEKMMNVVKSDITSVEMKFVLGTFLHKRSVAKLSNWAKQEHGTK